MTFTPCMTKLVVKESSVSVLWVSSVARVAHPSSGGHEVHSARFTIPLRDVLARLEESRERMERNREPPRIPLAEGKPVEGEHLRHRNYLLWIKLIAEVQETIERGENLEYDEFAPLVRGWCGRMIADREFAEVICPVCEKTYSAGECETTEWSSVAGSRAGIGGVRFVCPAGHTLFVHQTWVA